MPGKSHSPTRTKQGESCAQPNQRLPKGHFDREGLSTGKSTGAVRPTADAYQGPRSEGADADERKGAD